MRYKDARDLELTATSRAQVEDFERAVDLTASFRLDPLAETERMLSEDADFVPAYCLLAALGVMAGERSAEALLRRSVAAGGRLAGRATEREQRHFAAARAWLEGEFHRASALYGEIVVEYPRDLLALQVAHFTDFALGQQRLLRDRVAQVLPAWSADLPGYGYVLGMLAFGFEETNLFERAEDCGRRALELNRQDSWAVHAVAHVHEMNGRAQAGSDWLETRRADWAPGSFLAYHNFWHLALFKIALGEDKAALALFDEQVWPNESKAALELVDASSLLFRLQLSGVDVGARAERVASAWDDPIQRGYYAFNDAHAAMAYVAAGRLIEVRYLLRDLEQRVAEHDSNAHMTRDVALPFTRALLAFAEQRDAEVVETLLPLRQLAQRFGGSNAQRDVIELTLLAAAERAGRRNLVAALRAERALFSRLTS
jgi:hypothetical protein